MKDEGGRFELEALRGLLNAGGGRVFTLEEVEQVARAGGLLAEDGTVGLFEYVAFLSSEKWKEQGTN